MSDPGICFLCAKDGRQCDKGRPCGNCRARGVPQMCVGAELAGRAQVTSRAPAATTSRSKNTKPQPTTTTRPPLKQITGPEPSTPSVAIPSSKTGTSTSHYHTHGTHQPSSSGYSQHGPRSGAPGASENYMQISDSAAPDTPYINHELVEQMDGITLGHGTEEYGVGEGDNYDRSGLVAASPPPETYMHVEPKRPRKKRDRYPEVQVGTSGRPNSGNSGNWSNTELAATRYGSVDKDLMAENKALKLELERVKQQNDSLNKNLLIMAERFSAMSQFHQYMQHLKLLPTDYTARESKELVVGHSAVPYGLPNPEFKYLSPYAAFRDACLRYPSLPIVLFNLSQQIPVVALANDAFCDVFGTQNVAENPWVQFIAPSYLERTKHLLYNASRRHEAVKFMQVYKDAHQKQFMALDVHRFFHIPVPTPTHSSGSAPRMIVMDLVFLIKSPHTKYPEVDDYMYWQAPLNENGLVDSLQAFAMPVGSSPFGASTSSGNMANNPTSTSLNHAKTQMANSLTSSTGILLSGPYDPAFNNSPSMDSTYDSPIPQATSFGKIDDISSPSRIADVTTPPQDLSPYHGIPMEMNDFDSGPKTLSASPLDHWFPIDGNPDLEPRIGWDESQWSSNMLASSPGIPSVLGLSDTPTSSVQRSSFASPSSAGSRSNTHAMPGSSPSIPFQHNLPYVGTNPYPNLSASGDLTQALSLQTSTDGLLPQLPPFDDLDPSTHPL